MYIVQCIAFSKSEKSCCICCGKRNYEKNDYQFDITSENGIENKAWISIRVLGTVSFTDFTTAQANIDSDFDAFSFMTTSENFL